MTRPTYSVVGLRPDGTQSILTSHASRESAERVLKLIYYGRHDYVEFGIRQESERPLAAVDDVQNRGMVDAVPKNRAQLTRR